MSNAGMQHSHFITKYLIRFRQLTQTHSRRRPQTFPVCFQAHTWALSPSTEEDEHERPGWPTAFPPSLSVWRSHIHCGHVTLCKTPAALSTAVTSAAISRLPTIDPVEISHLAMNKEIEASVCRKAYEVSAQWMGKSLWECFTFLRRCPYLHESPLFSVSGPHHKIPFWK